jgi:hypothetical protein
LNTVCPPQTQPQPHAHLAQWSRCLHQVASAPLAYCEGFPKIAARFEAWWQHQMLDRPLLIAAPANPAVGQAGGINRRLDLLDQPETWFATKLRDMKSLHWTADSVPHLRVDFGPAMLGTLLDKPFHFASDTTWYDAVIGDDWTDTDAWAIDPANVWWQRLCELTERVAQDAAGKYLYCAPAYEATADVITNLRGATQLCMDVMDRPEVVARSINALFPVWHQTLSMMYDTLSSHGAGLTTWMRIWSSEPFAMLAGDVGYMLGQDDFNRLILPDIERQAQVMGRGIFHTDGPAMLRHLDALLEVPQIRVIQFTPGAGTPSILPFIDDFKKVQAAGRSLLLIVQPDEVMPLCDALDPVGLAFLLDAVPPRAELDGLFQSLCNRYGVAVR